MYVRKTFIVALHKWNQAKYSVVENVAALTSAIRKLARYAPKLLLDQRKPVLDLALIKIEQVAYTMEKMKRINI